MKPKRWIQDLNGHTVHSHLFKARLGIVATGLPGAGPTRAELGNLVFKRSRQFLFPQIRRLHNMGIGRHENLISRDRLGFPRYIHWAHLTILLSVKGCCQKGLAPRTETVTFREYDLLQLRARRFARERLRALPNRRYLQASLSYRSHQ